MHSQQAHRRRGRSLPAICRARPPQVYASESCLRALQLLENVEALSPYMSDKMNEACCIDSTSWATCMPDDAWSDVPGGTADTGCRSKTAVPDMNSVAWTADRNAIAGTSCRECCLVLNVRVVPHTDR